MQLQQLRYLCETVNSNFNLSRAAKVLKTSQPGVTRYIKLLEEELGTPLFVRDKKRLTGLTPVGKAVLEAARRAIAETQSISHIVEEFASGASGEIRIATAHAVARYTLPSAVERFLARYPKARLRIRQGHVSQLTNWVMSGEVDVSIATAPTNPPADLMLIPWYEIHRVLIAPRGHPILRVRKPTLADIAAHPIITYEHGISARDQISGAFRRAGLSPNIVLGATDADIMKTYVSAGLGIAIVAHTAFDPQVDASLRAVNVGVLFPRSTIYIALRRDAYLSAGLRALIGMLSRNIELPA